MLISYNKIKTKKTPFTLHTLYSQVKGMKKKPQLIKTSNSSYLTLTLWSRDLKLKN